MDCPHHYSMSSLDQQCFAIPVSCDNGVCPTWCLIELQGELELQEDMDTDTFPVGSLCQSSFVSDLESRSVLASVVRLVDPV